MRFHSPGLQAMFDDGANGASWFSSSQPRSLPTAASSGLTELRSSVNPPGEQQKSGSGGLKWTSMDQIRTKSIPNLDLI